MEEVLSTVNAEPEVNVEPQQVEQVEQTAESVNADNSEVTSTEQGEKPVQTPEENAKFAEQRRAREQAERRAAELERDHSISRTYGAEWGVHSEAEITEKYGHQGITTLAEFETAVREYEMKQKGVDPDLVKQYAEKDPDVIAAREWKANQAKLQQQQADSAEFFELFKHENGRDFDVKNDPFPPKMEEQLRKGKSVADAYIYHLAEERAAKLKAAETNKANAESSTGSLAGNISSADGFISKSEVEANKHKPGWVQKNLAAIEESMKKW